MAQQRFSPYGLPHNISPLTMPPPDTDTMIPQGVSAQLARSHVPRRSSTQSGTPNSSRRASARITKPGVVGNSPHYVQRRRTTAAHSAREHPLGNQYPAREQRRWHQNYAQQSMPETRPFSWHPGSDTTTFASEVAPTNGSFMGNAITGLQNLAVSNTPPSAEQSIQDAFSMGYGYPFGLPIADAGFNNRPPNPTPADMSTSWSWQLNDYARSNSDRLDENFRSEGHPPVQRNYDVIPGSRNTASDRSRVVPQEMQNTDVGQSQIEGLPEMLQDAGEVLIGIGLYDDARERQPSSLYSAHNGSLTARATGQDLKLEETWRPAKSEDEDGSSDEADETDELPVIAPSISEVQPAFYPSYGDLSNQSFFLNDEDTFATSTQ